MPRALTHTWINWVLSTMAPQVLGVTSRSPLCPGVSSSPYGKVWDIRSPI